MRLSSRREWLKHGRPGDEKGEERVVWGLWNSFEHKVAEFAL